MRTFSKGYGLAGARVGYGIGHPDLIKAFDKVRNHFGMNRASQIGALEALLDQKHLENTRELVKMSRDEITRIAIINGLRPISSAANFVCVDCKADGEFARKILNKLISNGIFVRMPFVSPQDRAIRISCGTEKDLRLLEKTLPKVLTAVSTD
jgi:histidinol-phosphate aminotransferase